MRILRIATIVAAHPNGRVLYAVNEHEEGAADLPGRHDTVSAFAIEPETGQLRFLNTGRQYGTHAHFITRFASLPPGSGPRHLAFHPTAKYVYVNGETDSTVSALTYDARTRTTLPSGFSGTNTTAEIQVDRAGRVLWLTPTQTLSDVPEPASIVFVPVKGR